MELAQVKRIAAAVRSADSLRRISGGSETDVYCSDAGHVVLKIKPLAATSLQAAHAEIEAMQETATTFATYLSATHTIRTEFMLSQKEFFLCPGGLDIGDLVILFNKLHLDLHP